MKVLFKLILVLVLSTRTIYSQLVPSIEWFRIYDGIGHSIDLTNDAAMDKDNNICLAGRSSGSDGSQDLLILKYSETGELLTEIRYISAPSSWEEAYSISIDSLNNLYCAGVASFGTSSPFAIFHKYSPDGSLVWEKNYYNTSYIYSEGLKITVDKENNFITGYHLNGACFTKYSSSGDSIWSVIFENDTSDFVINDVIIDLNNNVYISTTELYYLYESIIHLNKYNKNGDLVWHRTFEGTNTKKLITDKENNIIQLINSYSSGIIYKIDPDGHIVWEADSDILILSDIGIDNDNNIIVTGYDIGLNTFDYFTKKFSVNGSEIWQRTYDSPEHLKDYAMALVIDDLNNIYVTGASHNSVSEGKSYTLKYSDSGELKWHQKFDAPHGIFENGKFIFLDDSNSIYVGGDAADSTNGWDFFALKIIEKSGTSVEHSEDLINIEYLLKQNYPNPFNPSSNIEFYIPQQDHVKIEVYDQLGRKVKELVNQELNAGNHSVLFKAEELSSGIYYYSLSTNNVRKIKKAVLLK